MAEQYIVEGKCLTDIADGFRASRGTTEKYSLKQMAALAAQPAGGGTCDRPHIIEVTELPTENIDKNAVYLCGGAYYIYCTKLADVLLLGRSLADALLGTTFAYHYATTKPTDNIAVTDKVYNIYYIADENNLFLYGNFAGTGENMWITGTEAMYAVYNASVPFDGVVSDASEVTSGNLWAVVQTGWTKYLAPTGTLTITENGTHDVTDKKNVIVDTPDAAVVGVWLLGGYQGIADDYISSDSGFSVEQSVNFTFTDDNGVVQAGVKIEFFNYGDNTLRYSYSTDTDVIEKEVYYVNIWNNECYRTIDFGSEPQLVSSEFKEWLVANATRVERSGVEEYKGSVRVQ